MYRNFIPIFLLLASVVSAGAASLDSLLIINDAHTQVGQEFYREFCMIWNSFEGVPGAEIVITEEVGARARSMVQVLVGGTVVYVGNLSQTSSDVPKEAKQATTQAFYHVLENPQGGEYPPELAGSGI